MFPSASISLLGCSICWGSDGATLDAANAAVVFMLVLLVGVLGSFLTFIFYLKRRSQQVAAEADLISALSEVVNDDDADSECSVELPAFERSREPEMAGHFDR